MFETTIAGSLPKPAWLAEPNKLWPQWRQTGAALDDAKRDATLLRSSCRRIAASTSSPTANSRASISCMAFWNSSTASISPARSKWASAPTATKQWCRPSPGALKLKGRVHGREARFARAHTRRKLKIHHARADDHRRYDCGCALWRPGEDGDGIRRPAQHRGARIAGRRCRRDPVRRAGVQRLHGRSRGLGDRGAAPRHCGPSCTTAVHICYGYGIKANIDWKAALGGRVARNTKPFSAALGAEPDRSRIVAGMHQFARCRCSVLKLLDGKRVRDRRLRRGHRRRRDARTGRRRDRRSDDNIVRARKPHPPSTNCGMAPMRWDIALWQARSARPRRRTCPADDPGANVICLSGRRG